MSWQSKRIDSLCDVFTDGNWIETKDQSTNGIRLIQTGNVGQGMFKDRQEKARYISEDTFARLKCFEIYEGDCLISRLPDPVGRACLIPNSNERMITSVDCTVLRFKRDLVHPEFFNYFSQSDDYLRNVDARTSGATRKRISRKNLGMIEVPVPSLPEQKRIVAILDKAFSAIDEAKAKTEQNLKNARELFDSYLQQVFSQRVTNWDERPISELGLVQTGSTPKTSDKENFGDFIPFIKPGHFLDDGSLNILEEGLSEKGKMTSRVIPKNSVLMVCIGATIGKCGTTEIEVTSNQQINSFTPRGSVNHRFAYYQMLTPKFQSKVIELSGQATLPIINKKKWSSLKIAFPVLEEQLKIVDSLTNLKEKTVTLESIYQKKLLALDELRKSLLQKAFSGELTAKQADEAVA